MPSSERPTRDAITDRLRAAGCVYAEDEAKLLDEAAVTPDELDALVGRRVAGEPLEHLLGWAEFAGLRIVVEPGVFVPRRRTELLAREAIAVTPPGAIVVELGCGAGAVSAAILEAMPSSDVHAVDIDPAAVRCARHNLEPYDGSVYLGDLYRPLPTKLRGRVDVVVANMPYVPTSEIALMPPEARVHESHVALDGGADGLDLVRRVAGEAAEWLAPRGHVLVETSERQADVARRIFAAAGLEAGIARDENREATAVIGRAAQAAP